MCDWKDDGLYEFLYLLIQAAYVAVVLCWLLIYFHGFHPGVILGWQGVQDQVGVLQQAYRYSAPSHLVKVLIKKPTGCNGFGAVCQQHFQVLH